MKLTLKTLSDEMLFALKEYYERRGDRRLFISPVHNYFYIVDYTEMKVYKVKQTMFYEKVNGLNKKTYTTIHKPTMKEVHVSPWKYYRGSKNMGKVSMFGKQVYINIDTYEIYSDRPVRKIKSYQEPSTHKHKEVSNL